MSESRDERLSPRLQALVAEFEPVLDGPRARELTERTLVWSLAAGVFDADNADEAALRRDEVRAVVVASVYAHLCCPQTADAEQLDVAARFCLLFFCIDDADPEALPDLTADADRWSVGRLTPSLRRWLAETPQIERADQRVQLAFADGFHEYLRFRRAEPDQRRDDLGIEEHWTVRRQTVFIEPYIDLWLMTMGLSHPDTHELLHTSKTAACRRLVVDLVLVANDLGSLERDRDGAEAEHDLNLVHTYQRDLGLDESAAVDHLVTLHNTKVQDFCARLEALRTATDHPAMDGFVDLLLGIVDGNRAALGVLHFRYPDVASIVARLHTTRDRVSQA